MTASAGVGIIDNMDVELMLKERHAVSESAFVEMVVWRLTFPVAGSLHAFEYRLAFVVHGHCVLRYDNERGKGDHKHIRRPRNSIRFHHASSPAR